MKFAEEKISEIEICSKTYSSFQKNCNTSSFQFNSATYTILFQKWLVLFLTQIFILSWPFSLSTALTTPKICKFYRIFEEGGQFKFENISILKNWEKFQGVMKWHFLGLT